MNLCEFNQSNHEQRIALIWKQGTYLEGRSSGAYSICLYSMGKFFAEVWYIAEDNQISLIRGFTSNSFPEPYLEKVDLSNITS